MLRRQRFDQRANPTQILLGQQVFLAAARRLVWEKIGIGIFPAIVSNRTRDAHEAVFGAAYFTDTEVTHDAIEPGDEPCLRLIALARPVDLHEGLLCNLLGPRFRSDDGGGKTGDAADVLAEEDFECSFIVISLDGEHELHVWIVLSLHPASIVVNVSAAGKLRLEPRPNAGKFGQLG